MTLFAYVALWIFIFSVPWENVIVIPGLGTISKLIGILALGCALLAAMVSGRIRHWHPFHFAALLFVVWAGIGQLIVKSQGLPKTMYTYIQLFLVLWMIWELAPSRQRVLGLLTAYMFGAYAAAIDTILVFRKEAGIMRRFAAGGFDPNELAMTLALALPMAWYLGMTYRQPLLRWVSRGYLPIGLVALGLTGSRGGMVASIVALLIVPVTLTKMSPGRLAAGVIMLVVAGAFAVAYVPRTAMERLATTREAVEGGTLGGRLRIWNAGLGAFTQKPVMGYGTGAFEGAVTPRLGIPRAAHNTYLGVLVEQGMVGFALYLAMFITVFVALLNLPPMERRFGLVLLATLCMAILPLSWDDAKPVWFVLAALVGLAQSHASARTAAIVPPSQRRPFPAARTPAATGPRRPVAGPLRSADRDAPA
jgi:O-antigen ligase